MLEIKLKQFNDFIFAYLDTFFQNKYWRIKLSLFCWASVLFFSFPTCENLFNRTNGDAWEVILNQIDHPFIQQYLNDPESHNAKTTFRIFVPILCKLIFVHNIYFIYFIQLIFSIWFFYLVIKLVERTLNSKNLAAITAIIFVFIYSGQVSVTDVNALFDGIAITLLIASLHFKNPVLIFLFCSFAAWTDERALIATSLVFIYWKIIESENQVNFKNLLKPQEKSGSVILALIFYLILRVFLSLYFNLITSTGDVGLGVLLRQFNMFLFGLWTAFEGLWVMILMALISLFFHKRYLLLLIISTSTCISILTAFLVIDITRSIIYITPLFFISLQIIASTENYHFIKRGLMLSLIICVLVPTYYAWGGFRIEGTNPVFFKILDLMKSKFT